MIMKPNQLFEFKQLGPNDVLLGRGTGPNEYIGNIRFRETIRAIIEDNNVRRRVGRSKAELANLIVERIKELGGKFVKKVRLGAASKNGTGSHLQEVYEEVCDSVACNKVTQCIRHQLLRYLCPREPKMSSLTSTKIPPYIDSQELLPSIAPTEPLCDPPLQPQPFPGHFTAASFSRMLLSRMSEDRSFGSPCRDLVQHKLKSSPVSTTANSEALMLEEHRGALHFPILSGRNHVALTTQQSVVEGAATPPGATIEEQDFILRQLKKQASNLLHDEMILRRSTKMIAEDQTSWLGSTPPFGASPLGVLRTSTALHTLLAHELAFRRVQASPGGVSFSNCPASMIPPAFL